MKHTRKNAPAPESVVRREPDAALGLTAEEVLLRTNAGLSNVSVKGEEKTVLQIILSNVFTYFNLLFFFLAFCLVFAGSGAQNLLFLGVVFCNTLIGTVQELRAKQMLDRLNLVSAPRAEVVRDGEVLTVSTEELVLDDVVRFSAGKQIPADAILLEGELVMNESLVTGEADEIVKRAGDTLLSGSFVLSGFGSARLTHVGHESFVSRLMLEAKRHKRIKKPGMMRSLSVLVRVIGVFVLPLGAVLFWQQHALRGVDLQSAMESSVSAVIGMVPEGLYLLASAALALAVVRLGRRGILSHNLSSVETLARVDVLCVDKTGTITEEKMSFSGILPIQNRPYDERDLFDRLGRFAAASDADSTTISSIQQSFPDAVPAPVLRRIPFSSRYKFSGIDFGDGEAYLLGAPEILLGDRYDKESVRPYLEEGLRILLFCSCDSLAEGRVQGEIVPLCFVALENRVRETAKETFCYFAEQGVNIKVISGDNPQSVSAVALAAGIVGAERYVDASALKTKKDLRRAAEEYTVFGRVTPEQKRELIRALKDAGHTVAMTGDGVNDVLALKEADCSVAMASGSEAAANVSHIVLLQNDFSAMPSVVAEGRQVINNIQRSASLYLVKNIFSFLTSILLLCLPLTYPIQPIQLSLVSALTIGIPSFFLALEPNHERVTGAFLRNVISRAAPAGVTNFILAAGVMLFALAFPTMEPDVAGTVLTLLLCLVGFMMLFYLSSPFNRFRLLLFCLLVLGFLLSVCFLPRVFLLSAPGLAGWLLLSVFTVLAFVLFSFAVRSQEKFNRLVSSLSYKVQGRNFSFSFLKKKK